MVVVCHDKSSMLEIEGHCICEGSCWGKGGCNTETMGCLHVIGPWGQLGSSLTDSSELAAAAGPKLSVVKLWLVYTQVSAAMFMAFLAAQHEPWIKAGTCHSACISTTSEDASLPAVP